MPGPRHAPLIAVLLVAGPAVMSCGGANPANDFCTGYGSAMHGVVAAARQYTTDPAGFSTTYKSTMDSIGQVRAKAPDDRLRSAYDRAMFTFSVFSDDADLASFLSRVDFSADAVVIACADYGVDVRI